MIARMGSGWQTVLADLSLILFMVTATVVSDAPAEAPRPAPAALPVLGEPVAVWRSEPGGPSLGDWLAGQPADPRERLTLVAAPADAHQVLDQVTQLPRPARVLIEPDLSGPPYAMLTFDKGESQ